MSEPTTCPKCGAAIRTVANKGTAGEWPYYECGTTPVAQSERCRIRELESQLSSARQAAEEARAERDEIEKKHDQAIVSYGKILGEAKRDLTAERQAHAATQARLDEAIKNLDFLKSKGITAGVMKESGKEPYLAYVIASDSELDDMPLLEKLCDTECERDELTARLDERDAELAELRAKLAKLDCVPSEATAVALRKRLDKFYAERDAESLSTPGGE